MGTKKNFAEIKFNSTFPGDINKFLGTVETDKFKVDSVSKYLRDLEAELEVKIKEAILLEMAFVKDMPKSTIEFHILRDGRIVDKHFVPFKGRFEMSLKDTEETLRTAIECVNQSSKDIAKDIVKKLSYEIIHSEEFASMNKI